MARNLDADMYAGSAYGRTTNAGTAKAKQTYSWGGKSYDSVMDMHNAIFKDSDDSDKAPVSTALAKALPGAKKGLASKPKATTEVDPKERFFTGINTMFTESGADLDVYKPSVDIGAIYTQEQFTGSLAAAQGYVYRADMAEQTRELIAEAMNYDQDQINAAIRDINDAALKGVTDKEMVKRYLNDMAGMGSDKPDPLGSFGVPPLTLKDVTDSDVGALSKPQALYDFAEEMRNPSITTTELPSVEEEASLQETLQGLVDFSQVQSRDNPFQGGVQVALAGMTEQEFYQQANEVRAMLGLPLLDVPAAEPEPTVSQPSLSDIAATRQRLREQAEPQGLMSPREPELRPELGPVLYPSNKRSVITYVRDIYPDNPKAAAALAATIEFEGMENAEENVSAYSWRNITSSSSPAGWLKDSITSSNKPWAKKRTSKLYELYGGKPKTDADGNTIPLTREPTKEELKAVQTKLKERGFYDGAIDGIFGKGSKAALKKFQGIENSKLKTMSGDYPELPEDGELDRYTAKFFDLELRLRDHEGNAMIEYEEPSKPVVPAGEKVVDVTYNPYYRANGYSDQLGDVSKEGLEGNTPGAGTFRGRGPVQITNKTMYEKIRNQVLKETGVDIMDNPGAIADDLTVSKAATVAFLNEVGFDKLSPEEAIKIINPQMPSGKVKKRLKAYKKYLKEMQK